MNSKDILLLTCISFGLFAMITSETGPAHDKVVVCYVSTWAVYRPGRGSFSLDNIDPNLCTHLVYAFAGLNASADAIRSLDPWQDLKDDYGKGGYERITNLRKTYPHLKVSLAIGGWNEGSQNYSIIAADPQRRKRLVKSITEFLRRYNFDGLDLDWEYPTQRGGAPRDKQNFVSLVKELSESLRPHQLLLTSAFGASKRVIDEAYDVATLSKYLDYLHIMCYDYGGAWDKRITPNAPLRNNQDLSVEESIEHLIKLGAAPSKLVLGLPFYGRTFLTSLDGNFDDTANGYGFMGNFTRENGFMGYNEICSLLKNGQSDWSQSWSDEKNQCIAKMRNEFTNEMQVIVFDNSRAIANKVRYAMRKGLGGSMVWSIDTDDFHGDCSLDDTQDVFADFKPAAGVRLNIPKRFNQNYPLLRTINEATVLALDEITQEQQIKGNETENEIPHGDNDNDKGQATNLSVLYLPLFIVSIIITSSF